MLASPIAWLMHFLSAPLAADYSKVYQTKLTSRGALPNTTPASEAPLSQGKHDLSVKVAPLLILPFVTPIKRTSSDNLLGEYGFFISCLF